MAELTVEFPAQCDGRFRQFAFKTKFGYIKYAFRNGDKLAIELQYPPKFLALESEWDGPSILDRMDWSRSKSMQRVTDIDVDSSRRQTLPVSLFRVESGLFIDPGRWLFWQFTFDNDAGRACLSEVSRILRAHNIIPGPAVTLVPRVINPVWNALDAYARQPSRNTSALAALSSRATPSTVLDFELRYNLEACISKGLLYEGQITTDFLDLVASHGRANDLLENLITADRRLSNPMALFTISALQPRRRRRRIPKTCVLMHSVTVTPTTIYIHPVQTEVSNRVIRRFSELADRFLRVRFSDEIYFGKLRSQQGDSDTQVYDRVRRTLVNGIRVAGRLYLFLACGNSQFRENGAYFFCPTDTINVNTIRQWMGYFSDIREVPKYVSRIGQCFSTTRAVTSIGMQPEVTDIDDIERNGFIFTDGVGKLSKFLAHMISTELRLGLDAPSVFQFRMGGCKGILAVDPTLTGRAVHIRKSQRKFQSDFNQLEIIRVSSFASAYLNRQIILVLSALGIPDRVFVQKMRQQLADINRALDNDDIALSMLQQSVDFNQITIALSQMISGGFRHDPFVDSMLQLWRAWMMKFLKEKTNLFVGQGAFLLGCVDETATLRMDPGQLPQIFIQVPDPSVKGSYKVITGTCIIARNPALHPGDIRVVEAVDCERLHHLRDVVVLPQLGERDLANMCAGGDLDGDDFLVMWDPDLIPAPAFRHYEPMDYTAPKPVKSYGPVTQSDMIKHFCDYMKNDALGHIAVAHRAHADLSDMGVLDPRCIRLAQLHSRAVDYSKTGVPAVMETNDRVSQYPHWLEKQWRSYKSRKVLGQLYDEVERVEFRPQYKRSFDARILTAFPTQSQDMIEKLRDIKADYDLDVRRLMVQYGIRTEFEICSAFVMAHNKEIKDYKFAEEMGRLMSSLKQHYREICMEELGIASTAAMQPADGEKLGAFVAATYRVTAKEMELFLDKQAVQNADTPMPSSEHLTPLISFPWIFHDELLAIAEMIDSEGEIEHISQGLTKFRTKYKMRSIAATAGRFDNVATQLRAGAKNQTSVTLASTASDSQQQKENNDRPGFTFTMVHRAAAAVDSEGATDASTDADPGISRRQTPTSSISSIDVGADGNGSENTARGIHDEMAEGDCDLSLDVMDQLTAMLGGMRD